MAAAILTALTGEPCQAWSRLPSHSMRLCRCLLNLAHVSVVHSGYLPIVPGDRDRIPARFSDNAAIIGVALPINAGAFLEVLGFGDCHGTLPVARDRAHSTASCLRLSLPVTKRMSHA